MICAPAYALTCISNSHSIGQVILNHRAKLISTFNGTSSCDFRLNRFASKHSRKYSTMLIVDSFIDSHQVQYYHISDSVLEVILVGVYINHIESTINSNIFEKHMMFR